MKTKGGKPTASRLMVSSNSVTTKSYVTEEDLQLEDIWDEEFLGHDLPPKFKISRVQTPEGGLEKNKASESNRDFVGERAMWDEEFWGHSLPPNYTISRFRTPECREKRAQAVGKRETKLCSSGEQLSSKSQCHPNMISEDTFEYNFDRTVDSYVLSEEISGRKTAWGMPKIESGSILVKDVSLTTETFEDRALRFGVEDWNLLGKKFPLNDTASSKRSARRGIFHSPSGSDTSSLISTLESSSFSCGSEGSSFAKSDFCSASFNLSNVYGASGGVSGPYSAPGRHSIGARSSIESQFVELNILEGENPGAHVPNARADGVEVKDGDRFLKFDFLDGRMVESDEAHAQDISGVRVSGRVGADELSSEVARRTSSGAADESPESDSFFDSSNDSDWSGSHSASVADQGLAGGLDAEAHEFEQDSVRYLTEDRADEDWSSDTHFYDVSASMPSSDQRLDLAIKSLDRDNEPRIVVKSNLDVQTTVQSCADERRIVRSPKKILTTSKESRSLGSVLSHHLAFTAVPSLRYKAQSSCSPANLRGSPAKVTAACIEWLWSEKDSKKPVQALRALADRKNASRESLLSPPVRNLDTAFRELRIHGTGKPQASLKRISSDISHIERSPSSAHRDLTKESRESILASWAAVNGNDTGEAVPSRLGRPTPATCKGTLSTPPSLKQRPRGISPKKRSVSFCAPQGSKAVNCFTKPVSKNLAVELEVLCRPFGPVLKGVRFLPTAKRGLGRPPNFYTVGSQLTSSSTASATTVQSVLKYGRLQCVVTRDGLPSYSLIMEETEEIFAAKTLRVDVGLQESVSHVYTFHSFKGKGKGKSVWRQWGKKEKPGSDFAGNMTVTSIVCPVMTASGMQNFVESEFVLFDSKVKEIAISGPSTTSPYPRSSFSSWDTATPQRSPQGPTSSLSSPSSTYFSLPSPAVPAGAFSTPVHPQTAPLSTSTSGMSLRGSASLDKNSVYRFMQLERRMSLDSPSHPRLANFRESFSDTDSLEEFESHTLGLPNTQNELAAVVVRTPLEKSQGKVTPTGDRWGWGINFLRKSFDGMMSGSSPDQPVPAARESSETAPRVRQTLQGCMEKTTPNLQRCSSCGNTSGDEAPANEGLNITLILPSGEHGCSANGIDGPQPLIERWRSGGKCDCGSWDLGCGLRVADNQRVDSAADSSDSSRLRDSTLRLFLEGKKQHVVGLVLTPVKDGSYTLGFQSPISALHAFATAVAVLHSKNPIVSSKKGSESKRRLATRIPVKVIPSTVRSFQRQPDELSGSRPLVSYKLVCPDPPSSPFGRA